MDRPLFCPLFVFLLMTVTHMGMVGVYTLPLPPASPKNSITNDKYYNRYIPTSDQWECDNGQGYTTLLSSSSINDAMERSVVPWARNTPTMWGNGRRYPHPLGSSAIEGWNPDNLSAECGSTYVGSAPIVQDTVGGVPSTSPGTYRVLISDIWTSQQENGHDHRVYTICGVAVYHPCGKAGRYKMCKNFAGMGESEGPGQVIMP